MMDKGRASGRDSWNAEKIAREIVDYSIQKDVYQGQKVEGDYLIAYLVEGARWLRYTHPGAPEVSRPEHKNAYIGVAVHRTSDMQFIPGLQVSLTAIDRFGNSCGKQLLPYHPRPGLHHYGANWLLPESGSYTLRVVVDGLGVRPGGAANQKFVVVEFHNVMITTSTQIS